METVTALNLVRAEDPKHLETYAAIFIQASEFGRFNNGDLGVNQVSRVLGYYVLPSFVEDYWTKLEKK